MIADADIPHDELVLARLATAQLAMLWRGMLSVGLSALQGPWPAEFFAGRDEKILAHLTVLACIRARPDSESDAELTRRIEDLSSLSGLVYNRLQTLAGWRSMEPVVRQENLGRLGHDYSRLLISMQEFLVSLGVPTDYAEQQHIAEWLIESTAKLLLEDQAAFSGQGP